MATRNDITLSKSFGATAQQLLLRTITVALGGLGIIWAILLLPRFWQAASLDHVAAEIVQGNVFTEKAMVQAALRARPELSLPLCNPNELHNAVVLHLAMLNDDLAKKNQSRVEESYARLNELGRNALACEPSDGFTWLTLFWLDALKRGLRSENLAYLRMSYEVSPNEGWIAIWRNRLAVIVLDRLPPRLANNAVDDFVKLVDSGLYDEMASTFESAPPGVQKRIAQQLRTASPHSRQIFATVLYNRGLDVTIPDTTVPGLRSWER